MNKSPEFGYDPEQQQTARLDALNPTPGNLPNAQITSNDELRELFFGKVEMTTADHGDFVERKPYANAEVMRELERKDHAIQELQDKVRFLETHDALTLLYNRKGIKQVVSEYQEKGVDGTLIFLDMDNFKQINTNYGELIGDVAIQKAVIGMAGHFRIGQDIMGRWGGEEFVLFLPGAKPADILNKLRDTDGVARINVLAKLHTDKLDDPADDAPEQLFTFSGGIVALNHDDDLETAIGRANDIEREVKATNKNEIRLAKDEEKTAE